VGDEEISLMLSDLINYEDEKKTIFFQKGRGSALDKENETQRRSVLQRTISKILPLGFGESTGLKGPRQGEAEMSPPGAGLEDARSLESSMNTFEMKGGRDEG